MRVNREQLIHSQTLDEKAVNIGLFLNLLGRRLAGTVAGLVSLHHFGVTPRVWKKNE